MSSTHRVERPSLLDDAMPRWHHRERHRVATLATPEALLRSVERLTWGEVPVFRALMGGRFRDDLPADDRVMHWFLANGFELLARDDEELLIVAAHPTGRRHEAARTGGTVAAFSVIEEPGQVLVAFNFRCGGGFLTTETRVRSTDSRSRRRFAVYWVIIRAGSGLIRRVWLKAIRDRAIRDGAESTPPWDGGPHGC